MHLAIIGASAGIGKEAVNRALEKGLQVSTLSRSPLPIPDHPNLTKRNGSATNKQDLLPCISKVDAVIVTLGTGKSFKATTLYSDFARLLVSLEPELKKDLPIIVVTGHGAGDSSNYQPNGFMRLLFKYVLNKVYDDKTLMEEILSRSGLLWTIVRPGALKDKPFTGKYRVENKLYKGIGIHSVNRADVADFLIQQATNPLYSHQFVSITNQ